DMGKRCSIWLPLLMAIAPGCGSEDLHPAQSESQPRPPSPMFAVTDLKTLGGSITRANAVNHAGIVVGESGTRDGGPVRAFIWLEGEMTELPLPVDAISSSAIDINDAGDALGSFTRRGDSNETVTVPVLWSGGHFTELAEMGSKPPHVRPVALNNAGWIV